MLHPRRPYSTDSHATSAQRSCVYDQHACNFNMLARKDAGGRKQRCSLRDHWALLSEALLCERWRFSPASESRGGTCPVIRKFLMTMFANEISSAGVGRARERDAGINQTEFGGHQYDAIGNGYSTRVEGQHITVCARGEPGG